jgi:signal transduction histidine kinase
LNDEIDGGLVLFYDHRRSFHDDDCATATTIADHAALAIANADLRAQAEEIAINAERSRLARDLHDAVTQTLFATSLISEVLPRIWQKNPDEGKKKLMEIRELTRGALAEMRTLLMELRPTALMDVPLSDLLVQLSEAFTGQARVPVAFSTNERCALPAELQTGFYRIAQEALNNIAKHARASQVEMTLTHSPEQVRLWIKDNGRGFNPENISSDHLGLQIMAERAQAMNAVYDLQTEPGQGTCIEVTWERNGTSKTG